MAKNSRATIQRSPDDHWAEMLAQALAETGGPLTAEEEAWADAVFGLRAPGTDELNA